MREELRVVNALKTREPIPSSASRPHPPPSSPAASTIGRGICPPEANPFSIYGATALHLTAMTTPYCSRIGDARV
jgi:hypothetical protein